MNQLKSSPIAFAQTPPSFDTSALPKYDAKLQYGVSKDYANTYGLEAANSTQTFNSSNGQPKDADND